MCRIRGVLQLIVTVIVDCSSTLTFVHFEYGFNSLSSWKASTVVKFQELVPQNIYIILHTLSFS